MTVPYTVINLRNESMQWTVQPSPFVRLGPQSKVVGCESQGNLILNDGATFNRCKLGQYVSLGCFSYVADTTIGRYCTFASRISVGAFSHPTDWLSIHEFQYRDIGTIYGETIIGGGRNLLQTGAKATHIGSDVWIGDNAAIGRGVTIGDGAIVGLGAVVVQDVEPFAIVVGNPARVVRKRFPDAVVDDLMRLQWWTLGMAELAGVDFRDVRGAIDDIKRRVDRRREAKPS